MPTGIQPRKTTVQKRQKLNTIGLTGGIATGKSTVTTILQTAGATIIDADRIAREVVRQGTPGYRQVVEHFGAEVVDANGDIDRTTLAKIIFKDAECRKALNRIVHPLVMTETTAKLRRISRNDSHALIFLDVPLLFETGMDKGLSEIIVVYVPENIQLQRLISRDRLSSADARYRIRSQIAIEQKRSRATIVIDNSGSREQTRAITLGVYAELKRKYLPIR